MSPQLESLKSAIQDMEKERDFYFGKLRNIELICQEKEGEDDDTLSSIMNILYATDVSAHYTVIITLLLPVHRPAAPVQSGPGGAPRMAGWDVCGEGFWSLLVPYGSERTRGAVGGGAVGGGVSIYGMSCVVVTNS